MPDDYRLLYDASGTPLAFTRYRWIYNLDGNPIGMTRGNHVYTITGTYIGELDNDMVIDTGLKVADTSSPGAPQNPGSVRNAKSRDGVANVKSTLERLLG